MRRRPAAGQPVVDGQRAAGREHGSRRQENGRQRPIVAAVAALEGRAREDLADAVDEIGQVELLLAGPGGLVYVQRYRTVHRIGQSQPQPLPADDDDADADGLGDVIETVVQKAPLPGGQFLGIDDPLKGAGPGQHHRGGDNGTGQGPPSGLVNAGDWGWIGVFEGEIGHGRMMPQAAPARTCAAAVATVVTSSP